MTTIKLLMACAITISGLAFSAAHAENYGEDRRWFLSGLAGLSMALDQDFDNGPIVEVGVGKPFADHWAWQASLNFVEHDTSNSGSYERTTLGLNIMLFPWSGFEYNAASLRPYAKLGVNVHDISFSNTDSSNGGVDIGIGFLKAIGKVDLQAELRHQIDAFEINQPGFDDENFETTALLIGVHAPLGPDPVAFNHDSDGDGVPDRLDRCPNTAIGTPVDEHGCPADDDEDGVPNNKDRCPNTPRGVPVDVNGCPLDSDHDGVPNEYDACPATPIGVRVNAQGCGLDSDQDGVPDGIDQCPNTAIGIPVDDKGCSLDADRDGVPTKIDQCPNTLPGARVNSVGCVISQNVEISGVHFEFDKARLQIDSRNILDKVAESLRNEPNVTVVVEGHTDDLGSDAYNQKLSQRRAESVVNYLINAGVEHTRLTAKGYGEQRPIANNATEAGRETNRRVELSIQAK